MDEMQYAALTQAIENFRPEHSLETHEDFHRFYVPRPISPLAELAEQIRAASPAAKFLVYGHRGCGKTSELNHLAMELSDSHFTVVLALEEENDTRDLHYTELLTSLCRKLVRDAAQRGLDVDDSLLDDVLKWFQEVENVIERKLSAEGSFAQKVSVYFVELASQQKAEISKREERRQKQEKLAGELLRLMNRLIAEVQRVDAAQHGAERSLLAVVDSLDRCKLETVRSVFGYTQALLAPQMTMVYTVPLAFSHDPLFTDVSRDFGDYRCTIPVLRLFTIGGQRDEDMWGLAEAILELRRAGVDMPDTAKTLLIAGSGGVLSILFSLCYNACVTARARQSAIITNAIAQAALNDRRERFYERLVDEADYETLNQSLPSRMPRKDERFRRLVYENCIVEYTNPDDGKRWYNLHPLVRELVDEWRTERAATQPP